MRQKLYKELREATEKASMDILSLSIETAEKQKRKYQNLFNKEMDQIWQNEKKLPLEQRLTSNMIHLIEQRLANIEARLACIHQYKLELSKIQKENF